MRASAVGGGALWRCGRKSRPRCDQLACRGGTGLTRWLAFSGWVSGGPVALGLWRGLLVTSRFMCQSIRREASDATRYIVQFRSVCAIMLGLCGVFRGACIIACSPTDCWATGPCCTHFLSIKIGSRLCTSFGLHEGVAGEARSAVRVECPTRAGICLAVLVYRHRHFRWRASSAVSTAECVSLNTFRARS